MALKVCQICAVEFTLRHFLLALCDGVKAQGWDLTVVCSESPGLQEFRGRGYRILGLPIARNFNVLSHLRSVAALVALFRRERFDVVHAHTPIAALLARLAARLCRVPLVVYTAHGFYFHDEMPRWKRALFVGLERLGGRWTDLLFTQSGEDAAAAVRERIAPAEIVHAIGNGIDVGRFDPAAVADREATRARLGVGRGDCLVGMIGRQVREKGVAEFLQAATRVAGARPGVRFLLIGEQLDSDHAGSVAAETAAAQAALGDRLVVTGARRDIPDLLAAMDVFCLPSYREGMPRTIIEAMMMGLPVVATDIRGSREEVVAGVTGLLVPTRDAAALAGAMAALVADPGLRRRYGAAGRERAREHYDEARVVGLQMDLIRAQARRRGLPA